MIALVTEAKLNIISTVNKISSTCSEHQIQRFLSKKVIWLFFKLMHISISHQMQVVWLIEYAKNASKLHHMFQFMILSILVAPVMSKQLITILSDMDSQRNQVMRPFSIKTLCITLIHYKHRPGLSGFTAWILTNTGLSAQSYWRLPTV